jgi:hypothetical protein
MNLSSSELCDRLQKEAVGLEIRTVEEMLNKQLRIANKWKSNPGHWTEA